MKHTFQFERLLWDSGTGTMVNRAFVLVLNTDKIPLGPLHKVRTNKQGWSRTLSGAVTIRPAAKTKA